MARTTQALTQQPRALLRACEGTNPLVKQPVRGAKKTPKSHREALNEDNKER